MWGRAGQAGPDVFLHAAREFRNGSAEAIVIEDSVAGVTGAVARGMRVIGFTGASHTWPEHAEALMDAGATTVIRRLSELPATWRRCASGAIRRSEAGGGAVRPHRRTGRRVLCLPERVAAAVLCARTQTGCPRTSPCSTSFRPSMAARSRALLRQVSSGKPVLEMDVGEVKFIGTGVAVFLRSPQLSALREGLAREWWPWLTNQDRAGFRPHVTIQKQGGPGGSA
jgi:hypothetical protein